MSRQTHTMEMLQLSGKIAILSGGVGILAAPLACGLGEAGAHVVLAARNRELVRQSAEELNGRGLSADAEYLDLTDESTIRDLRDRILRRYGRLDILVNNAVGRAGGDLRHTTHEQWESTMRVNSTGLFLACQIFSESMQERRSGSIINIGSIYGMVGPELSIYEGTDMTNPANYAFAKGGMINFTRYLACYLAPHGVRANCISPGGVRTPDTPATFVVNYSRRCPMARMAEPDDFKGPVVFLASDASRYITGQNLAVDGGWTAH